MPIFEWEQEYHFLLTRRTEVQTHKGQISYGGMREAGRSDFNCASGDIEEVGIEQNRIETLGGYDYISLPISA
jgi:hypothetical protein